MTLLDLAEPYDNCVGCKYEWKGIIPRCLEGIGGPHDQANTSTTLSALQVEVVEDDTVTNIVADRKEAHSQPQTSKRHDRRPAPVSFVISFLISAF